MGWGNDIKLKKSKHIKINKNNNNIYLPDLTQGAKWRNSDCIVSITQLNPSNEILSCEPIIRKNDDNNYYVELRTYKYTGQKTISVNSNKVHIGNRLDYLIIAITGSDYGYDRHDEEVFVDRDINITVNGTKIGYINFKLFQDGMEVKYITTSNIQSDGICVYDECDYTEEDPDGYIEVWGEFEFEIYVYHDYDSVDVVIDDYISTIKNVRYNELTITQSNSEEGVALFYEQD